MLLSAATFIYMGAGIFYILAWLFGKKSMGTFATGVFLTALAVNTAGFFLRWQESYAMGIGRIPLSNMYESLVFFAICIAALYFVLERKTGRKALGAFVAPLVFLFLAYASLSPSVGSEIRPLVPALQSNWLTAHVVTCFLGYAGFAVAFATSIMFLLHPGRTEEEGESSFLPPTAVLDDLTYRMIVFGFLFLTIGIITGSVWANSAWGSYWSWDPKETWSLITWILYAALLHLRLMRSWTGRRIAWLSILGFIAVLFTFFGVNYLLSGLHSYGSF